WHESKAAPRPPPVRYPDTTYECQSIEAPQAWGGVQTFVSRDRASRVGVNRTLRTATVDVAFGRKAPLQRPPRERLETAPKPSFHLRARNSPHRRNSRSTRCCGRV